MNNDENNSNKKIWDRLKELDKKEVSSRLVGCLFLVVALISIAGLCYLGYVVDWHWTNITVIPRFILLILSLFLAAGALLVPLWYKFKYIVINLAMALATTAISMDVETDYYELMATIYVYMLSAFFLLCLFPSFKQILEKEEKNKKSLHNIK